MNNRRKLWFVMLCLILLLAFGMPSQGNAQGIFFGDSIQSGQVIDQNLILNGTEVIIDGTVNGDVIAFGSTVTVNGTVNGTLVTGGETVIINGDVTGNVIAGAVTLELGDAGKVDRDLYFAGARLTLPEGSLIQRDLFLVSLEAQLSGEIDRNIQAIIGPLQVAQWIFNPFKERISIIGTIQPESIVQIKSPGLAGLGAGVISPSGFWLVDEHPGYQQGSQIDTVKLREWGIALLRNLIALLIMGLIGIWLLPAPFNWATEKIRQSPWQMAFSGIKFYLGGWFIAILALLLVLALAIFFYSISLPNLGFILGALGTFGVGLWVSVFWLAITYVSKILVALLAGKLLLQRFGRQNPPSNLWSLLLGIVLYVLVASIPYLGWVVATVVTFLGLGALWVVSLPSQSQPQPQSSDNLQALAQTD